MSVLWEAEAGGMGWEGGRVQAKSSHRQIGTDADITV